MMLCLTKYGSRGPSSRYRVYQFLPYLEAAGIQTDIQTLHHDTYLLNHFAGLKPQPGYLVGRFFLRLDALTAASRYDLIFIQKEIFPYLPGVAETLLAAAGRRLVVDLDDAVYLYYEASRYRLIRYLLGRKFPRLLRRSRLVLAGNRYLADYASRYARRVIQFPTVVDTDRFSPGERPDGGDSQPVIGWIGSPETAGFLKTIAPALMKLAERQPFRLSIIGADPFELPGIEVSAKPWSLEEEAADLRTFDIGIMPLDRSQWSEGKCALKLLQYMSTGLPAVSSRTGATEEITAGGTRGLLASTESEWIQQLGLLLRDTAQRRELGYSGRKWVEARYSLAEAGPKLAGHLLDAAGGGA